MSTPSTPFPEIDPSRLEAVSGGQSQNFKWNEESPRSDNIIDCRGSTCTDSNGFNVKETLRHKWGVGHENRPLPTGDGKLEPPKKPGQ